MLELEKKSVNLVNVIPTDFKVFKPYPALVRIDDGLGFEQQGFEEFTRLSKTEEMYERLRMEALEEERAKLKALAAMKKEKKRLKTQMFKMGLVEQTVTIFAAEMINTAIFGDMLAIEDKLRTLLTGLIISAIV
jgi:hypothetical protein